jgi:hypothetical protein
VPVVAAVVAAASNLTALRWQQKGLFAMVELSVYTKDNTAAVAGTQ